MAKAKKTDAVEAKGTTAVANIPNYGKQFAGAGWEGAGTGDFQIPFLNQLQQLSPQCVEGGEEYNKDAKPGMFMNSVTKELYPEGLTILIALTQHSFVEWKPQKEGGGFVAEHQLDSEMVRKCKAEAKDPIDMKTPAGNELVETFKAFALLLNSPDSKEIKDQVVISFSRTKIKRYKQIMTRLRTFKDSARIPLFAHRLKMLTTSEVNQAKKPYKNVNLVPAINNDVAQSLLAGDSPLLEIANGLREAVTGGTARPNFETATAGASKSGKDEAADAVFA